MCGRFTLHQSEQSLAQTFDLPGVPCLSPRYNIAPTQTVLAIRHPLAADTEDGDRTWVHFTWGLVPSWAQDSKIGARLINARAETLAEKPSFRAAFKRRRCLIVADGFYEWHRLPDRKQPYYFHMADHQPFAFAGLWEHWENGNGDVLESCTIITTEANAALRSIHDRMPVILAPTAYDLWLSPAASTSQVQDVLRPYPATAMASYPVHTRVNNARYDHPDCLQPTDALQD
jgi:putative SOS response-associated peptidase YedK